MGDSMQEEILTKDENKIRKIWLILLVISFVANQLEGFLFKPISIRLMFSPLIAFLFFWLLYHCAYKEKGKKLLLLVMILVFIALLFSLKDYLEIFKGDCACWNELNSSVLGSIVGKVFFIYQIVCFYASICFIFLSCKLYKINKRWQEKKLAEKEKEFEERKKDNKIFSSVP